MSLGGQADAGILGVASRRALVTLTAAFIVGYGGSIGTEGIESPLNPQVLQYPVLNPHKCDIEPGRSLARVR